MTIDQANVTKISAGNTRYMAAGVGAFATTDTTVELKTPFTVIFAVILTPIGGFDADDQLSVDETVTNGKIGHTAGAVTVTRNSSGTSAGPFSYIVIGY